MGVRVQRARGKHLTGAIFFSPGRPAFSFTIPGAPDV
jgi:hypothetical protein